MQTTRCRLFVFLLIGLLSAASARAQEGGSVAKGVFTDRVDRTSKTYGKTLASPLMQQQLTLWTLIQGTPELLEKMKGSPDGQLRLHHVWRRYASDELLTEHEQILLVGGKQDLAALENEVSQTGAFSWRTWSQKQQLARGNWRVDILWDDDEPLICGGAECSFPFTVR
jgi:hypothetical protein